MPISSETLEEIQHALRDGGHMPRLYIQFFIKWMGFNRAYNETETAYRDWNKVLSFSNRHNDHWPEVMDLARELVSMECIGSVSVSYSRLVAPNPDVKSATHFLRQRLYLSPPDRQDCCTFGGCSRVEKRRICDLVERKTWPHSELAALMRLVYQVRCNLMHGEKRLANNDEFQTNRDRDLVRISSAILDRVLAWLVKEAPAPAPVASALEG